MPAATTSAELDDLSERPLTDEELATLPRVPRITTIRRALELTEEEFSETYRIPVATLQDWEAGRTEPDAPARAILNVIAREPKMTALALQRRDAAR